MWSPGTEASLGEWELMQQAVAWGESCRKES